MSENTKIKKYLGKNQEKVSSNLIIFVGGVPGVGKTAVIKDILRRQGIGISFNFDYIKELLRKQYLEIGEVEKYNLLKLPVFEAWKIVGKDTETNLIKGYLVQSKLINREINHIMWRSIKQGENVCLDSIYLLPSQTHKNYRDKAIMVYLYVSDKKTHLKRIRERKMFSHINASIDNLVSNIDKYRSVMRYSVAVSRKYGVMTVDMTDFNQGRKEILQYVDDRVKMVESSKN